MPKLIVSLLWSQVDTFSRDIADDHFWTIPSPNSDLGGADGSEWILEAADHGTYKVFVAYSASDRNPFRLLGLKLLFDIAHVHVPANSIYRVPRGFVNTPGC